MRQLLLFGVFLAVVSCKEISYKVPQPKGRKALTSIPNVLQGSYMLTSAEDGSKDTLIINSKGYMAASDQKQKSLGDSLVLKFYKGYYFVSINENPEWILRIIKPEADGNLTFMSMNTRQESFNALLTRLSQDDITIDSLASGNDTLYQIDPTPRQLLKLVKHGYFSETVKMQRIGKSD